ncbi:MAG TPA: Na+/H+ antiporter NhaA [Chloroflexota bacterium]|nr:Na+/H+ antiporter NhaA [Chloroflexota bacterium]
MRPFRKFAHQEASGGVLLLLCTVLALVWANSPWADGYAALWHTPVTVGVGGFELSEDLLHWINDGLMAVFFFVVGLEIKRELLVGELASPRRAALPIAAAVGGMLVPAALYALLNAGTEGARGWGVPMATDIAFALGVLALLGSRVPVALKVFVTALAVVDDIGAVLVIALFYTPSLVWPALMWAAACLAGLVALNRLGVRRPLPYGLLGVALWLATFQSGIHATVAGVLLAITIPARSRIDAGSFAARGQALLDVFRGASPAASPGAPAVAVVGEEQLAAVGALEEACEQVQTPLQRLEHSLHPWVAFGIMPVFALANAGVALGAQAGGEALTHHVTLGVLLGLVLGKQLGVTLFTWLAVRTGLAALPSGVTWRHIYGGGWLAGIGFTMSLFITGLAFDDPATAARAKVGILVASLIAGVGGWLLLRATGRDRPPRTSQPAAP